MSFFSRLRNRNSGNALGRFSPPRLRRSRRQPARSYRPGLELLEARTLLATVPLTISFTWLAQLSNPDSDGTDGDYYARVKIGDNPEHITARIEDDFFNPSAVNASWTITEQVDLTGGPVEVRVALYDFDNFANGADDPLDINSDPRFYGVLLLVNPVDGGWTGTVTSPSNVLEGDGNGGGVGLYRSHLEFEITTPFSGMPDSDGDGLFDEWETNGIDLDGDGIPELDLPNMGADPFFKDIYLEMDWMPGAEPKREEIQSVKAAFAVAPFDAGVEASAISGGMDARHNALFKPGINLWVDAGNLKDAQGRSVGDDFGAMGRGNMVLSANVSNLNDNFYKIKNANFDDARRLAFHYVISATQPANRAGTSTGGNVAIPISFLSFSTLNDTSQNWVADEWGPGKNGGPISVSITGGTGMGQKLDISSNDSTSLTLSGLWSTVPDSTSTYQINWGWGGWGERGGNDFLDFRHDATTIMHELGHNLNLSHGGFEETNYKPNYVSIMNYNVNFGITQNSGAQVLDYSPAKISVGGTTSGFGTSTTSLGDFGASWTTNQWAGGYVEIIAPRGLAFGGPTDLNDVNQNWAVNQWVGVGVDVFDVAGGVQKRTIVSNTATQFTVDSDLVLSPGWAIGYRFQTNMTQVRRIVSNTADRLVFADPWTFVPTGTTPYALYTTSQSRGDPTLPSITESALSEKAALDLSDSANQMGFTDGMGNLVSYPLMGIDRNMDGLLDGPDYDGDGTVDTAFVAVNANAPGDKDISTTEFKGHDDWRRISLTFRQFGDQKSGPVNLEDDAPKTLEQARAADALLNTADLAISVTPSATTVFQGDNLVFNYTVSVAGPNAADAVGIQSRLPAGVDFVSATSSQGGATLDGGIVTWNVGSITPGVPVTLRLEIIPYLVGNMLNTGFASTFDSDSNGANNVATATVAVLNVPPRITAVRLDAGGIDENGAVGLTVEFTDPGKYDTHTAEINWGAGPVQVVTVPLGDRQFTRSHQYLDDNPTNTLFDTYPIHVIVRDNNAGSDTADTAVQVNNVAPTLTNVAVTPQIDEHGVVTLSGGFLDPGTQDTFTLVVNWGEGLPQTFTYPAGTTSFSETHRYLDDNPTATSQDTYNITLNLSDDDSGKDTAALTTLVNNVRPKLQNVAVTPQIDEHGVVTLSGGILDRGTQDTFTLVVNWGEGGPQTFTYPVGTTSFSETHQYLDDNPTATTQDNYNITLNLSDDDSGADTAALTTRVKNLAPVIVAFTSDAVECGDKAQGDTVHVVGAFTDVGTQDTHIASISWGDGATTSATIMEGAGSGSIAGEHIYASGGMFRIVVTLTDDDTGQTTARTFALITGVGILDGQLQIVGTKQADVVLVNRSGNGWFQVHASFIADSPRSLPATGVTSIAMILCDGDDLATVAGNIDLPTYINGEAGDDQLNGGGGPNILLGGDGNDRIVGGSSHDILVGGRGADRIVGNGGDDILIAGTLGGSADPIDLLDELFALLADWSRERDRARIRSRLLIGGDNDADTLTGSAGFDWFFYDLFEDQATDRKNEAFENIG